MYRPLLGPTLRSALGPRSWLALVLAGCGHAAIVALPPKHAAPENEQGVTGTWDWVFRSSDDQGNLRVEQEEWHLVQRGRVLDGYYDRAVTLLSTDERLFRCN